MTTLTEKFYRGEDVLGPVDTERLIAEGVRDNEPWLVMFPDGTVREYRDRWAALKAINARARRAVRPGGMLVTEIEWRFHPAI